MSKRISSTPPLQRLLLLPFCSIFLVELELSFSGQIRDPCSTFHKSPTHPPPAPPFPPPHPAKRRRHLAQRRGFKILRPPVPPGPDHRLQLCARGGADPRSFFLGMWSRVARWRGGHGMGQLCDREGGAGAAPRRHGAAPTLLATIDETSSRPSSSLLLLWRPRHRVLLSPALVGRRPLPCSSTGLGSDDRRVSTSSVGSLLPGTGGALPSLPAPAVVAPSSAGRAHRPSPSLRQTACLNAFEESGYAILHFLSLPKAICLLPCLICWISFQGCTIAAS